MFSLGDYLASFFAAVFIFPRCVSSDDSGRQAFCPHLTDEEAQVLKAGRPAPSRSQRGTSAGFGHKIDKDVGQVVCLQVMEEARGRPRGREHGGGEPVRGLTREH